MKRSVCALVSGGLDSCAMLGWLARRYARVYPVFIAQGLIWEKAELQALRKFLVAAKLLRGSHPVSRKSFAATMQALAVLTLPVNDLYGAHWSTTGKRIPDAATPDEAVYLPGRNLMLLSKAAVFSAINEIPVIAIGSLDHNPFPDAAPEFFRNFATLAGEALSQRLQVIAPFRGMNKAAVIRQGRELPLHLSISCLAPIRGKHCGRCNKCAERQLGFKQAGVKDNEVCAVGLITKVGKLL